MPPSQAQRWALQKAWLASGAVRQAFSWASQLRAEEVVAGAVEVVEAGTVEVIEEVFFVHSSHGMVTYEVISTVFVMAEVVEDRSTVVGGHGTVVYEVTFSVMV